MWLHVAKWNQWSDAVDLSGGCTVVVVVGWRRSLIPTVLSKAHRRRRRRQPMLTSTARVHPHRGLSLLWIKAEGSGDARGKYMNHSYTVTTFTQRGISSAVELFNSRLTIPRARSHYVLCATARLISRSLPPYHAHVHVLVFHAIIISPPWPPPLICVRRTSTSPPIPPPPAGISFSAAHSVVYHSRDLTGWNTRRKKKFRWMESEWARSEWKTFTGNGVLWRRPRRNGERRLRRNGFAFNIAKFIRPTVSFMLCD